MKILLFWKKHLKGKSLFKQKSNFFLMYIWLKIFFRKGKLYLVFEFVEKTLLEILEERTTGL